MAFQLRNSRIKLTQGRIFWHEIGQQDPALVFLHGSWNDSSQWLSTLERLGRDDRHCCALDLLGFGESEAEGVHYSVQLELECLAEFLDALRIEQVYLIGHSIGGWVAASYALKHADRVRGLVLLAPEGVEVEALKKRWRKESWLVGRPPIGYWLLRSLLPLAKLLGRHRPIEQNLKLRQKLLQSPAACQLLFQRRRSEIQAELLDRQLDHLNVPVLILHAEEETPEILLSKTYADLIPNAQVRSLPPGSKDWALDFPDAIAQYIRDFIAKVEM